MNPEKKRLHNALTCPWGTISRREFLRCSATATVLAGGVFSRQDSFSDTSAKSVPRTITSVDICKRYDYPQIRRKLAKMFDEIGGVRSLVKGKYVTAKLNLVNAPDKHVGGVPLQQTVITHPLVALAVGSLLVEYGAKRVTFCDQLPLTSNEEAFAQYGYHMKHFSQEMEDRVQFTNTRNKGSYDSYDLVKVPNGGYIADAWEVNKTYTETDVIISIGKMKSHVSGGVTLGMKNLFGVPPSSMYGDDIYGEGKDEPDESATGYRGHTMHSCSKKPLTSVDTFTGRTVLNDHGYNVPRFIADLAAAFPIDLVVVDGISVIQSAEGWWIGPIVSVASPGLLIAGRNPVCTDAAGTAIMGFDPNAEHRTPPFSNGFNVLRLAKEKGLGENRISELDVAGIGLERAQFQYVPTYQRPKS